MQKKEKGARSKEFKFLAKFLQNLKIPGKLTEKQKTQYSKLFAALRRRKSSIDDILINKEHDRVFSGINCLDCANCCKTHSPIIVQKDMERISKHLHIKQNEFVSRYLLLDEDGDWVFHTIPCPFLLEDNKCSIYDVRPKACSEYPHTNRKKLYQIAELTLINAEICPAVSPILDAVSNQII